ncbi:tryptophan 2-C-methyltransferase [Planomonospora sp. ID91781]|uniref:Tryptophan 2-C-methyltransferase n=1 Tax=Planomonospora sphaerica TaxID=161355 RepID=A0A171DKC9_9ACTN|nr:MULTISPECIES: tryptophan 2-C-methyltransferase [Planomonospora]MBG0822891.1 tryptophan 2-C-methyltransferase [Planomonospora sp. ID91781]GAT69278.1 tryptophan 2-C-methyltransferase [Planomonospora sphaerica]
MRHKGVVVLVNPNQIHPPIAPYALDVLTTALEAAGFEAHVLDLTFHADDWRQVLRTYFRGAGRPLLVGVTCRNTDTVYAFEQRPFVDRYKEVIDEIRRLTDSPVVTGGVGFSTMPFALVDYFGVDFGVKGPGEHILCELAEALHDGRPADGVPGLLVNHGRGKVVRVPPPVLSELRTAVTASLPFPTGREEGRAWQVETELPYTRRSGVPYKVDNLTYYRLGGLGSILTKNGCVYRCTQCVEPDAKGTRLTRRSVASVVDEIESLTGQGIYDLHTTDSEFNLSIAHSKQLLREIIRRKDGDASGSLHRLRLWVYCQPSPFDEELAELLAHAGCAGVNIGTDHVRSDMLDGWKVTKKGTRYYGFEDTARLVELSHRYGMLTMVEALLGMPGETRETMRECVDRLMDLDATVTGFSLGLRLFPYTDLAVSLARRCDGVRTLPGLQSNNATGPIILKPMEKCSGPIEYERQFMFDESGGFRLVCYFSPDLPESPETVNSPNGIWHESVDFLWSHIPESEYYRVMLPTLNGSSENDNNYADNPFLTSLKRKGYTGAFWAHWRDRENIMNGTGALEALAAEAAR